MDPNTCAPQGAVAALNGSAACELPVNSKRTGIKELDRLNRRTRVLELTPNAIALQTTTGVPSLLVTPLPFVPGWSASVDGNKVDLIEVNGGLIALRLKPGKHQVRLQYYTGKKFVGYIIAWGTVLLLTLFVFAKYAPLRGAKRITAGVLIFALGSFGIYRWQVEYLARVDRRLLLHNSYDELLGLQLQKWRAMSEDSKPD